MRDELVGKSITPTSYLFNWAFLGAIMCHFSPLAHSWAENPSPAPQRGNARKPSRNFKSDVPNFTFGQILQKPIIPSLSPIGGVLISRISLVLRSRKLWRNFWWSAKEDSCSKIQRNNSRYISFISLSSIQTLFWLRLSFSKWPCNKIGRCGCDGGNKEETHSSSKEGCN